jgi:uncharacterized membrane protein YphA (DoxX/SURF4 family)
VFESFCKDKLGPLALRIALGLVCAYHGYLKIMANGGTAWNHGLAVWWQLLIAWGEFAAGLAILLGFRTRLAATSVLVLMIGQLAWFEGTKLAQLPVRSLELPFLLLLSGLALLFLGAGELSVDGRSGAKAVRKK